MPLPNYLLNSLVVGVLSTAITLLIALPASYAFVRFRAGGRFLPSWILGTYVAPPIVISVPVFMLMRAVGLVDRPCSLRPRAFAPGRENSRFWCKVRGRAIPFRLAYSMATKAPQASSPPVTYLPAAVAATTAGVKKPALFSIFLAHISVDMQTGSLTVLLPLLLASLGLNYSLAALIISVNNLVIALAQPLFGIVGDRKPMRWLMFAGAVLCGTAMVSVTLLPSYGLVLTAVVLSGLGSAAFHPEGLAAVRAVSGDKPASGTSFFFFGGNLGFALGPFLATLLIANYGTPGAVGMIVPTALATAMLFLQRHAFGARAHLAGGRLPGDIVWRRGNVTVYVPLGLMLLLSILLTLLLNLIFRR